MYRFLLSELDILLENINKNIPLYLPVDKGDTVTFEKYRKGVNYAADGLNTVRSAKDFFFPQVENIAKFKLNGKSIEILGNNIENESFAVFGVRACDAKSFEILDKVFLTQPVDPYYKNRREKGTIITVACNKPEESCFCSVFGIDPAEPKGDISTWISDGFIYWQSNTEKGDKLTSEISFISEKCDAAAADKCKENIRSITAKLPFDSLDLAYWNNASEKELFSSPVWNEIYKGCIGCGTCTFVCPTCQCYDVRDFDCGSAVQKFRCWDSCMYSDFTKMAHGNPRKTQMERFRQRFMHKLKYFPVNNDGNFSCVGCGRCIRSCPQSLNIIKVARSVAND